MGQISGAKAYVYSNTQNYNRLLCFYNLKIKKDVLSERDVRLKSFGTHFCLVNRIEFIKKVNGYAKVNGLYFYPSNIKYITDSYRGAYNPNCKSDEYLYQKEFRFILCGERLNLLPEKEPLKIRLDGMNEIMTKPQPIKKLFEIQTSTELRQDNIVQPIIVPITVSFIVFVQYLLKKVLLLNDTRIL